MIGMAHDNFKRRVGKHTPVRPQKAGSEVDTDEAAALANRRELAIRKIAGMRADCVRVRMACDKWRVGERHHIPEACLVDVRKIDEDLQVVAGLDERPAFLSQAGTRIRRTGKSERDAMTEHVWAAPNDAK